MYGFEDGSDDDQALNELLPRPREKNSKFNPDKLVVRLSEIPFFGHIISKNGIKPDPKKVEAIMLMQPTENEKQLSSFLELVNFLNNFSPHLSILTKPLRNLLSKDNDFVWSSQQQTAFDSTKEKIQISAVLPYSDPKAPIIIQVEASTAGLSTALQQNAMPVAFVNKTLLGPETRYSNIAVVFGLERFHHY